MTASARFCGFRLCKIEITAFSTSSCQKYGLYILKWFPVQFMQEKCFWEHFSRTIYEHLLWTFCQTTSQTALSGQSQAQVFEWPLTLWLTKICLEHKQNVLSHLWLLLWRCWLWAPQSCTLSVVQRSPGDTERQKGRLLLPDNRLYPDYWARLRLKGHTDSRRGRH